MLNDPSSSLLSACSPLIKGAKMETVFKAVETYYDHDCGSYHYVWGVCSTLEECVRFFAHPEEFVGERPVWQEWDLFVYEVALGAFNEDVQAALRTFSAKGVLLSEQVLNNSAGVSDSG